MSDNNLFSVVVGHNKPIIMEIVGSKGQKVAEYVDTGDDKLPYYEVTERVQI